MPILSKRDAISEVTLSRFRLKVAYKPIKLFMNMDPKVVNTKKYTIIPPTKPISGLHCDDTLYKKLIIRDKSKAMPTENNIYRI